MHSLSRPIFWIVIGKMGSGKDTVGRILSAQLDLPLQGVSELLLPLAHQFYNETSRDALHKVAFLPGTFENVAKYLIQKFPRGAIVTGVRAPELIHKLELHAQIHLLWVDATDEIRYKRISERGRDPEFSSLDRVLAFETQEYKIGGVLDIETLHKKCSYTFYNNGTYLNLKNQVDYYIGHLFSDRNMTG